MTASGTATTSVTKPDSRGHRYDRAMRLVVSLVAAVIAVGACSSSGGATPSPSSQPVPDRLLRDIVADAATRARVAADAVQLVRAEARTWGDGSWGCPQPGMYYTQALVDGFQVIVSAGGREYDYRASGTRFRLCDRGATSS
jgi:hypothetical protein